MSSKPIHLLLAPVPGWGHIRPICVLAARIVNARPDAIITVLTSPTFIDKGLKEITRQAEDDSGRAALKRIRVAATFQAEEQELHKTLDLFAFVESYPKVCGALLKGEPITCAVKNTTFDAVPPPSLAILDINAPQLQLATRALGPQVQILAWVVGGVASIIRFFGPESLGGMGDIGTRIDEEVACTGRPVGEVGDEFFKKADGSIIKVPGLPPMYDWEQFPQLVPSSVPLSAPLCRGTDTISLKDADGIIFAGSDVFEKESLDAYRQWISESNRPVYALGPLLPAEYGKSQISADKDSLIESFLNNTLTQYRERSLVFISFGSFCWPTVQEYLEEIVDALLECKVPFLFCHASPFARIPGSLVKKVEASRLGHLSTWAPQQTILSHPVTGWYLTHGGQGGVTESLGSGIPMIFWPFNGDQPTFALHISATLRAGLELVEVRTGPHGLKPLKRNGRAARGTCEAVGEEFRSVLKDVVKGEKGKELRRNAERLKAEFAEAWEEDGIASKELAKLFERYF